MKILYEHIHAATFRQRSMLFNCHIVLIAKQFRNLGMLSDNCQGVCVRGNLIHAT